LGMKHVLLLYIQNQQLKTVNQFYFAEGPDSYIRKKPMLTSSAVHYKVNM
jgi:hypothetical protein